MSNQSNNDALPVLLDLEETPELSDVWRGLFAAAWDAYELIQQRRADRQRQQRKTTTTERSATLTNDSAQT